jgi:hypothetical protein
LKNEVAQPYTTSVQANVQSAYRRDLEGYGQAEFAKQSHIPSTTAAPACAIKSSAIAQPAVISSAPSFGQAAQSHASSITFAADKLSSSSIWSAVPYSTPAVTHDAPKQEQQTPTLSPSLPMLSASTPLVDSAVPTDARILVNTLRPANTTTESLAKNIASPAESTVKLERITSTTASVATAPASMLLQPYYPTTTGAANATSGIAAATSGAISHSNNTLPEFEGAAVSSSSFIAGSVIALAIAALAL